MHTSVPTNKDARNNSNMNTHKDLEHFIANVQYGKR
jgi:hypothetical protein